MCVVKVLNRGAFQTWDSCTDNQIWGGGRGGGV